ncbi:MAG: hypothetical protein P4M11_11670 [Candidatus Pacebacteria bacterium]|nr:hypothetical protein [Candidatus Paceibacterota bacterium]
MQYNEPLLLIGTKSLWMHLEELKEDLANIHRHLADANNQYDFQEIVEDLYKKVQLELTDSQLGMDTTFILAKLY